jgi:SAM-dependent methyltransferase
VRDLEEVAAYYAKILPFYEEEARAGAHASFWRGLARRWRPGRILEIGSGLGFVSEAMSREAPTLGIDISLEMLAVSSRRRGSQARFLAADARDASFSRRFDLIVAASDPFCHLTKIRDRRRALSNVARLLSPGGRFVLDGLYRPGRRVLAFERRVRRRRGRLDIAETWQPIGRDLWRATYGYRDRRPRGPAQAVEASFVARAWDPAKIRAFFSSCGLTIEETWGDFRRSPFRKESPRLIVVAKRRARFVHRRRG